MCFKSNLIVLFIGSLTLAAALFSATPATATVILYQDNFDRTGALNGTTPDITSGLYGATAGATWTADSVCTTNGTLATLNAYSASDSYGRACYLPFTPQTGHIYTFSATIQCTNATSGGNWLEMGFSSAVGTNGAEVTTATGNYPAWALFRYSSGANNQSFVSGAEVDIGNNEGSPILVQMVLNTNPSPWTETFYVNSVSARGPTAFSSSPTINYIDFGTASYVTGTVSNVQVSVDVTPEPSTLALLGAGLVGLLCYAWRKRK